MTAIDRSVPKVLISSVDGKRSVEISKLVQTISIFEDLFSPMMTAHMLIVSTGISNDRSIYQSLPIRGGERVSLSIPANSEGNIDIEMDDLYVQSVSGYISGPERELFNLNLVTREAISNETSRLGKRYPKGTQISTHVENIVKEGLSTDKKIKVDPTMNPYGFIGNMKKPFTLLTWLSAKSVSGRSRPSQDSSAGYVFYQSSIGYNFCSIDHLMEQRPFSKDFTYNPSVIDTDDPNKDFKILTYATSRNQDLIGKLERGAYSSVRYYINPVSFEPSISVFNSKNYVGKVNTLGDKPFPLPRINDDSEETLGDIPSRIFVAMLDIGTLERDASDDGWNDSVNRNANPERIHSQAMMRYNQIFTQVIEITIPLNTNLLAGVVIRCIFPQLAQSKRGEPDPELSGLYMIKELAHYFDGGGSYTKLKIVRDSFGRK